MAQRPQAVEQELAQLARLLLDYAQSPGRYAVRLGEPRALFDDLETVAQWALGRLPPALEASREPEQARALARAAVLFIQRACFDRENTHYQVLGLTREDFSERGLRLRYRALIRLTHPDIGIGDLPATAAGMVNRAYEVLKHEPSRRHYDEQLGPVAAPAPPPERARTRPAALEPLDGPGRGPVRDIAAAPTLRERWMRFTARYPHQMRALAVVGVAGVVLAGLLAWLVHASVDGSAGVLVAAQPTEAAPRTLERPAPATPERSADEQVASLTPEPELVPEEPELPASPTDEDALDLAAAVAASTAAPAPEAALPTARAAVQAPATPPPEALPASEPEPRPEPPARAQPRHAAPDEAVPRPAERPARVRRQPVQRVAAAAPPAELPASAVTDVVAHAPAPVWNVDAAGARSYLDDIVATLEQGPKTRSLNAYLARMNVKGSLLQPVAPLHARAARLDVHRSPWNEAERPGVLNVESTVVLQARAEGLPMSVFRLAAEFRGTPNGTVLERLELREGR